MTTEYLITEIEQLKRENEELRAYSNRVEIALVICDAQHNGSYVGCGLVQEVLEERISKSLAEIKANAVIEAAQSLFSFGEDADHKNKLEEYANKLRGEAK
tara:strand:- start:709 stop:1011 length:303 start_codon:yes stop_codon:yes gene_type:complete